MATLVYVMMALVCMAQILKLTFTRKVVVAFVSAVFMLFCLMAWPYAIEQSRTVIETALQNPKLMLDVAVAVSVDVALGLLFCVTQASQKTTKRQKLMAVLLKYVPSLLLFPALFALQVLLVFQMPGTDFQTLAWCMGGTVALLVPVLVLALGKMLPESEIRLELLFLLHVTIGLMGVVATVNGRTAVVAESNVALKPLLLVVLMLVAGLVLGLALGRYMEKRKLRKI